MDEPKLPLPVARVLAASPPARSREIWQGVERKRARRRALRHAPRFAAVAVAAAALLFVVLRAGHAPAPSPAALALRGDATLPSSLSADSDGYRVVDLSDGSRITIARGAKLDVLIASPKHVELVLREGRARFDVRPRGPRTWRIRSSGVTVDVVGTSFVVERQRSAVTVDVAHGVVLVRAPGLADGVKRLNAGDSAHVPVQDEASAAAATAHERAGSVPSPVVAAAVEAETEPAPGATRLARSTKSASVLQPLASGPSVDELWHAIDQARVHHEPAQALALLDTLRERNIPTAQRALAAFTSGKLALAELSDPARAARDLAAAVAIGLPSPLDIDARTRLAEAYARSGNNTSACEVVRGLEARGIQCPAKFEHVCDNSP